MTSPLTKILGIGPASAQTLTEHGYHSVEDIADATVDAISAIPGFGTIKATQVIISAVDLTRQTATEPPEEAKKQKSSKKKKKKRPKKNASSDKSKNKKPKKDGKKGKKKEKKKVSKKSKKKK